MEKEKKEYNTPELTVYGDVEVITAAGAFSGGLDAGYPPGTPSKGGLFS